MSTLQFGLTPKMKPLTPNRSVLVAALDVGTSKIACLIGRLKPRPAAGRAAPAHPFGRRHRLWPHACPRHEGGHRDRSCRGGGRGAPMRRPRRAHRENAARLGHRLGLRRTPDQRTHLGVDRDRRRDHRRARHRPRADRRQPPFRASRPRRAAFAADRLRARPRGRHQRPARHARRGNSASTCMS